MDLMHTVTRWMDHNRWTLAAMLLAATAIVLLVGCQPRTASLSGQGPVDARQFELEILAGQGDLTARRSDLTGAMERFNADVETFNARVQLGRDDLARQEQVRAELLALLGAAATDAIAGQLDPRGFIVPALGLLGGAFGIGKTLDNRRKDRIIRQLQAGD